jgi:hypothetical protein
VRQTTRNAVVLGAPFARELDALPIESPRAFQVPWRFKLALLVMRRFGASRRDI